MYNNKQIIKALQYLKSGEILSFNEQYVLSLGFSTPCYILVNNAMVSVYGVWANWPIAVNMKALLISMKNQYEGNNI